MKSLVVESIKAYGYAVLNADDPMVLQASDRVRCKIIYFSKQEDNLIIHRHLSLGGKAVFIKNDYIIIATEAVIYKVLIYPKSLPPMVVNSFTM